MIASGLCMMGGCFAQDEAGAAVDTYWVAEKLHLDSAAQNVRIANAYFQGGDSNEDVLRVTFQVDRYYYSYLIASIRSSNTADRVGLLVFMGDDIGSVIAQDNGNSTYWKETYGEKFIWWAEGGKYKRGHEVGVLSSYSLADDAPRMFSLGSSFGYLNRMIYNVEYANARTGVRMQWQPMAGLSGVAFFEPTTATLAEQ